CFFFSSRRRHTRCYRDWSSDVCSSDLDTWNRGGRLLTAKLDSGAIPLDEFLAEISRAKPVRVPGTAVYLTHAANTAPLVLLHHRSEERRAGKEGTDTR